MRGRYYLFIYILALLFVMFDSGVYADDGTLVFRNEPTFDQLDEEAMYTNPSVHTTSVLIGWVNNCRHNVFELSVEAKFLVMKQTAAYGGLKWKSKTKKLIAGAEQALTLNYSGLFVTFVNELIDSSGRIDREQQYALACKEVNAHITKMNAATEQWSTIHSKATIVLDNYIEENTSSSDIFENLFEYKPDRYPPPSAVYPTWECKGNGLISKQCDDTFDNPYAARDTHGIKCGGEKDPNPSVGGCGRYYYTCQDNYDAKRIEHGVKYCDNYISWWPPLSLPKRVGICGAPFRDCQFSASRKGVHSYTAVESTVNGNKYISGYTVKISGYRGDDGKSYHHAW